MGTEKKKFRVVGHGSDGSFKIDPSWPLANKGVPGLDFRTVGWLVSPVEGRQKKFWTPL